MLSVKGFISIFELIKNEEGQISRLGELSEISRTYSLEIGEYVSDVNKGYRLHTFSSTVKNTDEFRILSKDNSEFVISVCKAVYEYAKNNIRPFNTVEYQRSIRLQHTGTLQSIAFGQYMDIGTLALPEWIEFTHSVTGDTYRIWMADEAFQQQYDLSVIKVVPIIEPVDTLFNLYGTVVSIINGISFPSFMSRVQVVRNNQPETVLHIMDFDYVNPLNKLQKKAVSFAVLIHGASGDNIDAIKDAIVNHILQNSEHTREEWEVILPDVFRRTEFSIYPRWDKIAIPNLTDLAAVYSSITDYNEIRSFVSNKANHYDSSHVLNNIEIIPHTYKYITLVSIPGPTNEEEISRISDIFPDYIPVQNTALDFGRMTENTRNWCNFLFELIETSESMTRYSNIPSNMRRVERSGKLYITGVFDGVNYLVSAKING